jgi:hypothetical protein
MTADYFKRQDRYTFLTDSGRKRRRDVVRFEKRQIPNDARLHNLREASQILTEQYQSGYSIGSIRRYIRIGAWNYGWHYTKTGNRYKIYIPAIQEWQVNGARFD